MLKVGKIYYNGRYLDEYAELPEIGESWKHGDNQIKSIDFVTVLSCDQYPRAIYDIIIVDNDDERETIETIAVKYEEK